MSIIDKAVAAVTPPESEEDRAEARRQAMAAATPGDWLSTIIEHHLEIESAFEAVKAAGSGEARRDAQERLGIVLTGHAIAEESVIYPAMIEGGEKGHAGMGYTEQAAVKTQMAMLEKLDPMSQEYLDKLEHIRGAVAHHVYQEEGGWFLDLKNTASQSDQAMMTHRYKEEWSRYVGEEARSSAHAERMPMDVPG